MTGDWDPTAVVLITAMARAARGPRREGIYAMWLTLRVALDLLGPKPPADRAHKRRLAALEHRISTLTVPPPLRRALTAALAQLRTGRPEAAVEALALLGAPSRESAGADVADAITSAARAAREQLRLHRPRGRVPS